MFDGSYRSNQRTVNLGTNRNNRRTKNDGGSSSNRKRTANTGMTATGAVTSGTAPSLLSTTNPNSRDNILYEAHRLRLERYQKQQQTNAATKLQQHVRGIQLRKRLLQQIRDTIMNYFNVVRETSSMSSSTTKTDADMIVVEDHCITGTAMLSISKNIDMAILSNVYFRLHQQQRLLLNDRDTQQTTQQLLHQFSIYVQQRQEESSTRLDKENFVLPQFRPNTCHILQATILLTPVVATTKGAAILSSDDVVFIISYILQLQQHHPINGSSPTMKSIAATIPPAVLHVDDSTNSHHSALSTLQNTKVILQMMIDSFTDLIFNAGHDTRKNDHPGSDSLSLPSFLYYCIQVVTASHIYYRPIFGVISLIYYCKQQSDIIPGDSNEGSYVTLLRRFLSDIMNVVRPIPAPPVSSSQVKNKSKDTELNNMKVEQNQQFVSHVVSQLLSQYQIPILLRLYNHAGNGIGAIIGVEKGKLIVASQANDVVKVGNNNAIGEQYRTQEQEETMFISSYVQFLKYLLLGTSTSTAANMYHQKSDPIADPCRLLWMIQCAVRGDDSSKVVESSQNDDVVSAVDIIDDGVFENDDDIHHNQEHENTIPDNNVTPNATSQIHLDTNRSTRNNVPAPSSSKAYPSQRRLTKYDLLTLPKLDRKFIDIVQCIDHSLTMNVPSSETRTQDASLRLLAKQICDPNVWVRWGNKLFSNVNDMDDDFYTTDRDMEYTIILRHGQDDFISLLVMFLQTTTGLRVQHNAITSPFLKVLPFSSMLMSNLWKYILRQLQIRDFLQRVKVMDTFLVPASFLSYDMVLEGFYRSMSLFSDLFSHHLIAINDEQFLRKYTKLQASASGIDEQIFLVDDVIVQLRTMLNELYWTKPVYATDLKVILNSRLYQHIIRSVSKNITTFVVSTNEDCLPFVRARLLLTGTKLYNSLYERWCRLVAYAPFCDESIWWFPVIQTYTKVDNVISVDADADIDSNTTEMISVVQHQLQQHRDAFGRSSRNDDEDPMDIDETSSEDESDRNHLTVDEESDQLAAVFSDPKMARLLGSIPQVLPFERRVKMFDSLIRMDKLQSQDESSELQHILNAMIRGEEGEANSRKSVHIRRDELYSDSMEQLNKLGSKLKGRVHVTFTNQVGTEEAGIDGGGVFKEFIDDLIKDAFSVGETTSKQNLFSATPYQTLTVNTELLNDQTLLSHYEFLGRVLGKAVYESILVEAQFCLPFLNQILGKSNSIEDLKNFDSEYYNNVRKLLVMSASDIESLGLTFELTLATGSTVKSIDLVPNGSNISVTKANVVQYVLLVSHHRLNVLTSQQTRAFLRGFRDLIPASWVRLFSAHELQKVISGDDSIQGIDVPSLKKVMQYAAGYHPSQSVIEWFWEIIEEMTPDQQRKFLKFMTSCSRQPLLGFGSLEPAPCVQQIRLPDSMFAGRDDEMIIKEAPLPTSSTCMNLFKLPNYHTKELMRRKLLAAIESGAGFELT